MGLLILILSVVLGAVHLRGGLVMLLRPRKQLLSKPATAWVADRTAAQIRGIGLVRIVGAAGLFVPWYADELLATSFTIWVFPVLTPVAAALLGVIQFLVLLMHLRRHEKEFVPADIGLLILALAVAALRSVEFVIGCWGCAPA